MSKAGKFGAKHNQLETFLRMEETKNHLTEFIETTNLDNLFLYDACDTEHGEGIKDTGTKRRNRPWLKD